MDRLKKMACALPKIVLCIPTRYSGADLCAGHLCMAHWVACHKSRQESPLAALDVRTWQLQTSFSTSCLPAGTRCAVCLSRRVEPQAACDMGMRLHNATTFGSEARVYTAATPFHCKEKRVVFIL
jgi:hypothetical protein